MATDDATLMAEVRTLTDYPVEVLSDADLQSVVTLAKRELRAKSGVVDLDVYGNLQAERALFWLTCLFAKIRAGELDGVEMQIGDIRTKPLRVDGEESYSTAAVWRAEFNDYYDKLLSQFGGGFGSRGIARNDRVYGE